MVGIQVAGASVRISSVFEPELLATGSAGVTVPGVHVGALVFEPEDGTVVGSSVGASVVGVQVAGASVGPSVRSGAFAFDPATDVSVVGGKVGAKGVVAGASV